MNHTQRLVCIQSHWFRPFQRSLFVNIFFHLDSHDAEMPPIKIEYASECGGYEVNGNFNENHIDDAFVGN